jgi:hypothetical protein
MWIKLGVALNASIREISSLSEAEQLARFSDREGEMKYGLGLLLAKEATVDFCVHAYSRDVYNCGEIMPHRSGDLLIGFAALGRTVPSFELSVGSVRHESLVVPSIQRGEWRIVLGGRFPIPIISLCYTHHVRTVGASCLPEGCWAVCAHLSSDVRRQLCQSSAVARLSPDVTWVFSHGRGGIASQPTAAEASCSVPLPELSADPPLAVMKARALKRMDVLREALMRAAWHPARMRSWCLAHDDEFAQGAQAQAMVYKMSA